MRRRKQKMVPKSKKVLFGICILHFVLGGEFTTRQIEARKIAEVHGNNVDVLRARPRSS